MFINKTNSIHQIQSMEQASREEIAQLQQTIQGLKQHISNREIELNFLARTMDTQEKSIEYAMLRMEQNREFESLKLYTDKLEKMMQIANFNFGQNISEQAKKEIYHLYHSGKYTQVQLAEQYHTTQSTVSKIVNSSSPTEK